jgi:hypothetical protein
MTYIIFILSTITILQSMAIYVLVKNMVVTVEYEVVVDGEKMAQNSTESDTN